MTASARQAHSARVAEAPSRRIRRPASGHDLICAAERFGAALALPQPNWPYAAVYVALSSILPMPSRVASSRAGRTSATSPSGLIASRCRRLSAAAPMNAVSDETRPMTTLCANPPYTPRPSASLRL